MLYCVMFCRVLLARVTSCVLRLYRICHIDVKRRIQRIRICNLNYSKRYSHTRVCVCAPKNVKSIVTRDVASFFVLILEICAIRKIGRIDYTGAIVRARDIRTRKYGSANINTDQLK